MDMVQPYDYINQMKGYEDFQRNGENHIFCVRIYRNEKDGTW